MLTHAVNSGSLCVATAAFFCLYVYSPVSCTKEKIYIGGFFPMQDGAWDGSGILPAAEMAVEDINSNPHILANFELKLVWNNSKCNVGESMKALFHQLETTPQLYMILGAGCSSVTKVIAETVNHWNLVQVSHASSSPDLQDRDKYPFLFLASPSELITNPAKVALLQRFGWKRVALLQSKDGSFDMIMTDLHQLLLDAGIEIIASEKVGQDPRVALMNLQNKEARVILAVFFPDRGREVFCMAYKLGMTGPTYTWMLPGWYENDWWKTNTTGCRVEELQQAVNLHIATAVVSIAEPDAVTDVFRSPKEFTDDYNTRIANGSFGGTSYATAGYDSVWVIAYALNKTNENLEQGGSRLNAFTYNSDGIRELIYNHVNSTDFVGVSGKIQFNSKGMRLGTTRIKQYKGNSYVSISTYDTLNGQLVTTGNGFEWKTTDRDPPSDGPSVEEQLRGVNVVLFYNVVALAVGGISFNIFLLVVNIVYRHRRILRMTSPNINYLICSSSLLMYISTILLGIDERGKLDVVREEKRTSNICTVTAWMMTIGFTLSFGSIISKAWRIRKLMANKSAKKQNIKDWHLFLAVAVLGTVDIIILTTWSTVDPLKEGIVSLDREKTGEDAYILPYNTKCTSSSNAWTITIYVYKGLLLLYGAIVAWEQRKIKMTLLNEARPIAMTIYTVMVLSIIAVPVCLVLDAKKDFVYGVSSMCIIFGTTSMLGFSFLPKVQIVLSNSVAAENVIISNMTNIDKPQTANVDSEFALKCKIEQLERKVQKQEQELLKLRPSTGEITTNTSVI